MMKKYLFIPVLVFLLCFSACSAPVSNPADTTPTNSSLSDTKPTATQPETNPTESVETFPIEPGYFPIPVEPAEFSFSSGAVGWRTDIEINRDGTFTGKYTDTDMGASGEGYLSTTYICEFSGVFTDIEQINDYSCKVRLTDVNTHQPVGKEWIENAIRYIASEPYGLNDPEGKQKCEEFIVYLPNTPIDELPEAFLTWWPYWDDQKTNPKTTLSCYGILNVTTNDGFFFTA